MSESNHDDLPPLGQPSPPRRPPRREPGARGRVVVPVIALVLGLLVGFAVAQAFDGEPGEQALSEASGGDVVDETSVPSTTTLPPLPQECVRTIRSAQQALVLLDEGLQSLGELDLVELERVRADMQRLREGFARRAQECLEEPRVGPDG